MLTDQHTPGASTLIYGLHDNFRVSGFLHCYSPALECSAMIRVTKHLKYIAALKPKHIRIKRAEEINRYIKLIVIAPLTE